MKKATILILVVGLLCAACSSYTCPTYSNKSGTGKAQVTGVKA